MKNSLRDLVFRRGMYTFPAKNRGGLPFCHDGVYAMNTAQTLMHDKVFLLCIGYAHP
jgi:hypothetical protein